MDHLVSCAILISNAFADVQLLAVLFGLLSFTGLVGAVVISAYVAIRWTFIWPVVAFDGLIGIAALRRSWELTEGYWWRTFGVLLMVSLAVFAVGFPALLFGGIGGDAVGKWYSDIVAPTIAGPIQAIMIFLLYADLRTRRETPPRLRPRPNQPGTRVTPHKLGRRPLTIRPRSPRSTS